MTTTNFAQARCGELRSGLFLQFRADDFAKEDGMQRSFEDPERRYRYSGKPGGEAGSVFEAIQMSERL